MIKNIPHKFYLPIFLIISIAPFWDSLYFGLFNEKRASQIALLILCIPYLISSNISDSKNKNIIYLLLTFSLISVFHSENPFYSLLILLHIFMLTALIKLGISQKDLELPLFITSIILSIFSSGMFFLNYFFYLYNNTDFFIDGVFSGFYNIRFFNHFQVICVCFSLYLLMNKNFKSITAISLVLNFLIIMISSARGASLAIIIIIFIGAYMKIINREVLNKVFWLFIFSLFLFIIYILTEPVSLTRDSLFRETSSGRLALWEDVIRSFNFKTILFGNGAGTFKSDSYGVSHPHNSVISLLFDWGAIVTLLILYLLFNLISESLDYLKFKKDNNTFNCCFLTFLALLSLSLVSGITIMPIPQTFLFILAGLIIKELRKTNKSVRISINKVIFIYAVALIYFILSMISFNCQSHIPSGPNFWANGQVFLSSCQ
ncbi:O-antigen ligase family protein [Pseudoalteromonas lipolytica]|uniref:O-antigen ligase family protein n=1 Tax=Pseudoalteromonas TaxID=53246 RepID=UPI0015D53796|nr:MULTISPECIES: O-antigen ligase family protein [unclassified Pseudoalteromonas]MCC9659984.1 hypothetical protein [Pseudoalteromonas sp. MB41]QLJ07778.1 hypothetical protein GZH31_13495 [Pseudoalteromonas sp. JSTW]QMW14005.1 hypothetical protein H3302_13175 [Pseudoalteromonas sp. MT33b]